MKQTNRRADFILYIQHTENDVYKICQNFKQSIYVSTHRFGFIAILNKEVVLPTTATVKALISLDGIEFTRSLRIVGDETISKAFLAASGNISVPLEAERGFSPFTDAWSFGREGVPVVVGRSTSEGSDRVVRYGHQEWGHTHADTLDKIDSRDMRDLVIQLAAGVRELSFKTYQPEHRTTENVHNELTDALNDYLQRSGRINRYR